MHVLLHAHTTPAEDLHTGKVNIPQLLYVKKELMPPAVVALVPLDEVARRKEEIDAQNPELADETRFVYDEEERRRTRARQPRMQVVG